MLCLKLEQYGVCGSANGLLRNYLIDRAQVTKYRGGVSSPGIITCGVPQGSIMGPLMFILYINDLPLVIHNCHVSMYADDTVLYYSGPTIEEVQSKLQEDLDNIYNWSRCNKLSLNVAKTN